MRLFVDTTRSGVTRLDLDARRLTFRKPETHNPDKPGSWTCAQAKCDGHRVLVSPPYVFTSQGIDVADKVASCSWYKHCIEWLPPGQWLDGEIFAENGGREALKTLLAEHSPDTQFAAFGYSALDPMTPMDIVAITIGGSGIDTLPMLDYSPEALGVVAKLGVQYDGVVYKNFMYGAWAKHKHQRTIDLVVLGIKPGTRKYEGQAGSLICGIGDRVLANVSGMDDDERRLISNTDIGRVVEVEYERVGSAGKLQHPRFLMWRDDKKPSECTLEQDPSLC